MIYAPSHIKKYAKQIQGENKYFRDGIYGEVTFAYEISCNCGNNPEEKLEKIINKSNDKFNVAIIIQYSDQFAFNDERFDENDITWCQIFLYDIVNLQSIMIVDDETA